MGCTWDVIRVKWLVSTLRSSAQWEVSTTCVNAVLHVSALLLSVADKANRDGFVAGPNSTTDCAISSLCSLVYGKEGIYDSVAPVVAQTSCV